MHENFEHPALILGLLLIFLFGLVSRLSERSVVTAPMVFVSVGIILGPLALNVFEVGFKAPEVKLLAEITLVLILFVDASMIDLPYLLRGHERKIPLRLLGLGLPMTAALGFLLAWILFDELNVWQLALLALILSPTDAALGQAVLSIKQVPGALRQAINMESGINDGLVLPGVLIAIAALTEGHASSGADFWLGFTTRQLLLGPLVGAAVGWLGGLLVDQASERDWMTPMFQRLVSVSLAMLSYFFALTVDGNGFIAAYCAGLLLGTKTPIVRERIQEFGEAEGQQLELFVFLIFGLLMVTESAPFWDFKALLYALLSLTVIRMLPVLLCLWGSCLKLSEMVFIGWFGPRGIASVLYLILMIVALGVPGNERVLSVIVLTVLLSVFLHGLTALPLASRYGHQQRGDDERR